MDTYEINDKVISRYDYNCEASLLQLDDSMIQICNLQHIYTILDLSLNLNHYQLNNRSNLNLECKIDNCVNHNLTWPICIII